MQISYLTSSGKAEIQDLPHLLMLKEKKYEAQQWSGLKTPDSKTVLIKKSQIYLLRKRHWQQKAVSIDQMIKETIATVK